MKTTEKGGGPEAAIQGRVGSRCGKILLKDLETSKEGGAMSQEVRDLRGSVGRFS